MPPRDTGKADVASPSNDPSTIVTIDEEVVADALWLYEALQVHRGEPLHLNADDLATYFNTTAEDILETIELLEEHAPNLKISCTQEPQVGVIHSAGHIKTTDRKRGDSVPLAHNPKPLRQLQKHKAKSGIEDGDMKGRGGEELGSKEFQEEKAFL